MNKIEALICLKGRLACLCRQCHGDFTICNHDLCDECDYNYIQGNMGEQQQALRIAIESLEKEVDCNDL